ncbi:hypothetical protein SRHO_G00212620 [Serrasalmus rhombeus]
MSVFPVPTVSFLGFVMSTGTFRMDPAKIRAILEWPRPTSLQLGNMVILVLVDHFSKACKFVALLKLPSAKETADILLQHVVRFHGMSSDLVSDRGPQFASCFWKAF